MVKLKKRKFDLGILLEFFSGPILVFGVVSVNHNKGGNVLVTSKVHGKIGFLFLGPVLSEPVVWLGAAAVTPDVLALNQHIRSREFVVVVGLRCDSCNKSE